MTFSDQTTTDSIDKVKEALTLAGLPEFAKIEVMSSDQFLGKNGTNISGGQKQRIAIARVPYRGANFLVLDEATSALDFKTENEVITGSRSRRGAAMIILITHRERILEICDKVYEVERGGLKLISKPAF